METTTTPDVGYTKTAINGFFEGLTVLLTATAKTSGKVAKVAVDGFKEGYNSKQSVRRGHTVLFFSPSCMNNGGNYVIAKKIK